MKRQMSVTDWVHVFAGVFIVGSLALGLRVHQYWLFLTGFVGLNLFQYGFTGFCPLALLLKRLGVREY